MQKSLGQIAYEKYAELLSADGFNVPAWAEFDARERDKWNQIAYAVVVEANKQARENRALFALRSERRSAGPAG